MSEDLHLFDPNEFGPGRRQKVRAERMEQPVEPLADGWLYMRNRHGVLSHAHLVAATVPNGCSTTLCGKLGTMMPEPGVEVMRRCPMCDVASQLQ